MPNSSRAMPASCPSDVAVTGRNDAGPSRGGNSPATIDIPPLHRCTLKARTFSDETQAVDYFALAAGQARLFAEHTKAAGRELSSAEQSVHEQPQRAPAPAAPYDTDDLLAELDAKREEQAALWNREDLDDEPRGSAECAGRSARCERVASEIQRLERLVAELEG